jgi:hypothetical protein
MRFGLFVLGALQFLGRDARATSGWQYTWVDGKGSGAQYNNGNSTTGTTQGATSAILYMGEAVPLYTRYDAYNSNWNIHLGIDLSFGNNACTQYDAFTISTVDDTHIDYYGPGALQDGGNTWIAYSDSSGDIYAGVSVNGPAAAPMCSQNPWAPWNFNDLNGTPSIAVLNPNRNEGAYVFYTDIEFGSVEDTAVYYVHHDNSKGTWTSPAVLDGPTKPGTDGARDPSAVSWHGQIWTFYKFDVCIKGQHSDTSGGNWTSVPPNGAGCVDGQGGGNGQTFGFMLHPTAMVDPIADRLYVFYADSTDNTLRVSYLDAGSSTWHAEVVGPAVMNSGSSNGIPLIAPVMNGGHPQVYYVDQQNQRLMHNTRNPTWGTPVITDGPGCTQAACSTSVLVDGPIAAVMRPDCNGATNKQPHVFYTDTSLNALREAFYE